jgi:hypothetical protein
MDMALTLSLGYLSQIRNIADFYQNIRGVRKCDDASTCGDKSTASRQANTMTDELRHMLRNLLFQSQEKDRMAHEAALMAASLTAKDGKPVILNVSLILGDVGQFSRIANLPFTPITHEWLPFKAAPGQLTASEIMALRILMKIVQAKRYAILGHNIAYSVSPQMHGAAFAAVRLPHQYGRADVETVEEFVH